jgi:hypothetical protein
MRGGITGRLATVDDVGRRRGRLLPGGGDASSVASGKKGGGDVVVVDVADVCLIEVGGTVGDIQSSMFLEALCQSQFRVISGAYYRWQKLLASSFCTWNLLDISLQRNQVVFLQARLPALSYQRDRLSLIDKKNMINNDNLFWSFDRVV